MSKSIGIIVVGIFFILMGIYSLGISYKLHTSDWSGYFEMMDKTVKETIDGLEVLKEEKEIKKLKDSGKLEEFNEEYNSFVQELLGFGERYKENNPKRNHAIIVVSGLTGILCLLSGFALFCHFSWARIVSFLSLLGFGIYYVLNWFAIYPVMYMVQLIADRGNKLNLMIDPAYTDLSQEAGRSVIKQVLFGFPLVLLHFFVLFIIIGIAYYLSQPNVVKKFQQ